jgi:hypothetical protein
MSPIPAGYDAVQVSRASEATGIEVDIGEGVGVGCSIRLTDRARPQVASSNTADTITSARKRVPLERFSIRA